MSFKPLPPKRPTIWDSCPKLSDGPKLITPLQKIGKSQTRSVSPIEIAGRRESLWKGPLEDGISYSLLCKFLGCMERFRLQVVEGLKEPWGFKHAVEFGSMFHVCMEADDGGKPWKPALEAYYQKLLAEYPANEKDVTKWYLICCMQFPIYVAYCSTHETQKNRKMIYEEQPFWFCHTLPPLDDNGMVRRSPPIQCVLRGKLDCAFESGRFIYLQENKTKGEIDHEGIGSTIDQNLQTCIYHLALRHLLPEKDHKRIAGTLYNVIRRPLSDRFALRQGKKETMPVFLKRVADKIKSEPQRHFFRWSVPVLDRHLNKFRIESLDPILRHLCRWWDSIKDYPFHPEKGGYHFRTPYGMYNSMASGFRGDYFQYLTTGSRAGLERITDLFPEIH